MSANEDWNEIKEDFFRGLGNPTNVLGLLDWMPDLHFFAKNKKGQFMAANRASLARNGCSHERELIGKTDFDFHPFALASAYVEEDRRVMAAGETLPEQTWLVLDHTGLQRWFLSTKFPLFSAEHKVIGIAGMMRPLTSTPLLKEQYQELAPAVDWVMKHAAERISTADLAAKTSLSLPQFERRFRALFKVSPTKYIILTRINEAKLILARSKDSISEVALRCGFYDQSQFGKLFKRETGSTPLAYRRFFQERKE